MSLPFLQIFESQKWKQSQTWTETHIQLEFLNGACMNKRVKRRSLNFLVGVATEMLIGESWPIFNKRKMGKTHF